MKPTSVLIIGIAFLLLTPVARAESEPFFPRIGTEYLMVYSTPKPMLKAGGESNGRFDTNIQIKILKVQADGWVLASRISYDYTYSERTAEQPTPQITGKKKQESKPLWFNLSAFSEAIEMKE